MKNRKKMNIYHSLLTMRPLRDENVVVFIITLVLLPTSHLFYQLYNIMIIPNVSGFSIQASWFR
jgi:hypothetical protein